MQVHKRTYLYILCGFLLLCFISLYRQVSIAMLPHDRLRPYLVYAVYLALLGGWLYSLRIRITQKTMLNCLRTEGAVMGFWLTIRFLQEGWFYRNVHVMRMSGYLIAIPMLLIPLLGFYASCCLAQGDTYTIPLRRYLLLLPVGAACTLILTNEKHHLMVSVLPDESENLYFHPNTGIIFPVFCASALILARIVMILFKTHRIRIRRIQKMLPLLISIAMPATLLIYLRKSFVVSHELIELTAKLFFLEAMSWESCILLGLIPVNTRYPMVFERSTVGMRIVDASGDTKIRSGNARPLTAEQFSALKQNGMLQAQGGAELHLHRMRNGYLIYQKDVSKICAVIEELHRTAEELTQEGHLLQKEIVMQSEKAAIDAKNKIYDRLSNEVGSQLRDMTALLQSMHTVQKDQLYRQLLLVGTYVKRRCNLVLIHQESGTIPMGELRLTLSDFVACMNLAGIAANLIWEPEGAYAPAYMICIFDAVEQEMERICFAPDSITVAIRETAEITVRKDDKLTVRSVPSIQSESETSAS